jgi:hypothetical protein
MKKKNIKKLVFNKMDIVGFENLNCLIGGKTEGTCPYSRTAGCLPTYCCTVDGRPACSLDVC